MAKTELRVITITPLSKTYNAEGYRVWGPAEVERFEEKLQELNRQFRRDDAILGAAERMAVLATSATMSGMLDAMLELDDIARLLEIKAELVTTFTRQRFEAEYGLRLVAAGRRSNASLYRLRDLGDFMARLSETIRAQHKQALETV